MNVPFDISRQVYTMDFETCLAGHDLTGANALIIGPVPAKMCRKCRGIGNRSYDYEWTNGRGQVFLFRPDHPNSRKDGFVPRSRIVAEFALSMGGEFLAPEARVYHLNEDPGDDDLNNLRVFKNQHELAQYRSQKIKAAKLGGPA